MTDSYKSTNDLVTGDYLHTPDTVVFERRMVTDSAVFRVVGVEKTYVNLKFIGQHRFGLMLPRDGKTFVRYIGKRPPWALEGK